MTKPKSRRNIFFAVVTTLLIVFLGLLFIFEASAPESFELVGHPFWFVRQHSIRVFLGLGLLVLSAFTPKNTWHKLSPLLFFGSLVLLLATLIPGLGVELNGAKRWLNLGPLTFQPVELLKISVALYFGRWLSEHQRLLPWLTLTALPASILLFQPDFGSLLIIGGTSFCLFFLAGANLRSLALVSIVGLVGLSLAVFSSPYRLQRVTTFLDPSIDPLGSSYHIRQITIALGNGGLFGRGIGQSQQKYAYIPEPSTDSIFAIIAEEIGLFGSILFICLYLTWLYSLYLLIKNRNKKTFETLASLGLLSWISIQMVINLAAVVALIPLTGLPLPLISYGGTSAIITLWSVGILISLQKKS